MDSISLNSLRTLRLAVSSTEVEGNQAHEAIEERVDDMKQVMEDLEQRLSDVLSTVEALSNLEEQVDELENAIGSAHEFV
jgi:polyhydroxyalkanoate synthesis regulator phasin